MRHLSTQQLREGSCGSGLEASPLRASPVGSRSLSQKGHPESAPRKDGTTAPGLCKQPTVLEEDSLPSIPKPSEGNGDGHQTGFVKILRIISMSQIL